MNYYDLINLSHHEYCIICGKKTIETDVFVTSCRGHVEYKFEPASWSIIDNFFKFKIFCSEEKISIHTPTISVVLSEYPTFEFIRNLASSKDINNILLSLRKFK